MSEASRDAHTLRVDRADLERLTSAATAHAAFHRVAQEQGIAVPDIHVSLGGESYHTLTAAAQQADLDALEQAVIRTRRLLGWRR